MGCLLSVTGGVTLTRLGGSASRGTDALHWHTNDDGMLLSAEASRT